jgi:hypothetical protein
MTRMVLSTMESGTKTKSAERAKCYSLMVHFMMVSGKGIRCMGKAFSFHAPEIDTKVTLATD